jgi:selenide,water dikinase
MKAATVTPVVKHLLLLGGGHSHLSVLKRLGMNPVPGLAVTLISRGIITPYSGSLPGYISGMYEHDEIHIDLRPLAQFAGARIIQAEIEHIDLDARKIHCDSRPDIEFDILSLNIGSKPDAAKIPGADLHAVGVKPIDQFLQSWQDIFNSAVATISANGSTFSLAIVGSGPASVELAFAAQHRIHQHLGIKSYASSPLIIKIISADSIVLKQHNSKVRQYVRGELQRRGIEFFSNHKVTEFRANTILCENKETISADSIVFATGASIPLWPGEIGLAIAADGFIEVNNFLQSSSHDFVFAAGDAATIRGEPRPKSGVYAVRQGKPLAENLIRFATGKKLKVFKPQRHALALINMGNKRAIASRHNLFLQGRALWSLKNKIDTDFIRKYSEFPQMLVPLELTSGLVDKDTEELLRNHAMRCAGCAAKVTADVLTDVLQGLPDHHQADILNPTSQVEDAAVIRLDAGRVLLQSVDQLKAFVNDPWLFAKIATNHCLSDIYAMGCLPHSALAIVGLPFASKNIARRELKQLMLGCSEVLHENECALVGGHSAETSELQFGLCVNGFAAADALLGKDGMQTGDIVILTKPLGSGTLLAADMRYQAQHQWMDAALQQMLLSNRQAARCFVEHKATACTDVTGFGLAGHLLEMMTANNVEVELSIGDLPVLDGALETLERKIFSSLHNDNSLVQKSIYNDEAFRGDPIFELLFDPQTAGGLIASVPEAVAEDCLQALKAAGCSHARVVGRVSNTAAGAPALILK